MRDARLHYVWSASQIDTLEWALEHARRTAPCVMARAILLWARMASRLTYPTNITIASTARSTRILHDAGRAEHLFRLVLSGEHTL